LNDSGTTKAGKPRQRRKLTDEINQFLLRCYLKITRLEIDMTGNRQKMHQQFMNEYPEWQNVTQQRLADRIATICRNYLMPQTVLNRIIEQNKKKVKYQVAKNKKGKIKTRKGYY
jgi:hypothetical protein